MVHKSLHEMVQKRFILEEPWTCSTMTCGLAAPQMRTSYWFTVPDKGNIASSPNTMHSMKPSVSICMKLQNCSWCSWSLPVRACTNRRLYGLKWSHLRKTSHTVFWDIPYSWLAHLLDFSRTMLKKSHTQFTISSNGPGRPGLLGTLKHPVFLNVSYHMFHTTALLFCL